MSTVPAVQEKSKGSKGFGVVLILLSVVMAVVAANKLWHALINFVALLFDIYFVGMMAYYWCARIYKDGITWKEIGSMLIYPRAFNKLIKSFSLKGAGKDMVKIDEKALIGQRKAFWGGVIVTLILLVAMPVLVLIHIFHILAGLAWFVVAVWLIGATFTYWGARLYRGGITFFKLVQISGWPFTFAIKAFKAGRHKRQAIAAVKASASTPLAASQPNNMGGTTIVNVT